ncbi:MAG: LpxL/LpxP family acyltransferase [Metallibacterium sp.]
MRWHVAFTYALLRLAGRLPLRTLHALGAGLGMLLWRADDRERRNVEVNLGIACPEQSPAARAALARECLRETGRGIAELGKVWGGGAERALRLVREVRGQELFDAALVRGRGLIVAAPHLGCWELLNHWIGARTPLAILYRPPRQPAWEPLLRRARGRFAPEQVRAEGSGVRSLYRRLAAGGVVGILPDQQPRGGEGAFAPFFGLPAATMVLLPRLAERTGATVLFGFMERLPRGAGFRLHWRAAPAAIAAADALLACSALNACVEDCVRSAFTQYQWTYRRWSLRPTPGDADLYRQSR